MPPRLRGEVLRSRGILLRRVGRVREAVDAYVDAIAIFRKCGARRMEARAKNALAYAMFVQGRYEDAVALALESIQIDLSIGGPLPDRQDAHEHRPRVLPARATCRARSRT